MLGNKEGNAESLGDFLRSQSCALAAMGVQHIGLSKATDIPVNSALTKVNPMIDIIADGFRHRPHITLEHFNTLQLLSLFSPRCRKVEAAVYGNAKFQYTYDAYFMPHRLQCLGLL